MFIAEIESNAAMIDYSIYAGFDHASRYRIHTRMRAGAVYFQGISPRVFVPRFDEISVLRARDRGERKEKKEDTAARRGERERGDCGIII